MAHNPAPSQIELTAPRTLQIEQEVAQPLVQQPADITTSYKLLVAALLLPVLAAIGGAIYGAAARPAHKHHSNNSSDADGNDNAIRSSGTEEGRDAENAFAVSGAHFLDAHETLGDVGSTDGWTGGSGACYDAQNAAFRAQLSRVAEANTQVDDVVQTQAEQVKNTRETLQNLMNGVQAAIPVAEALYFSGPAGPALSYNFQLSVATPAMTSTANTTNTMQYNAAGHAQRLTALTTEYDDALRAISSPDSPGSPTSKSVGAIAVDPDYIHNLAPYHQQAAATFTAANSAVRGAAETISAAHGRICDASKDALQRIEDAHNVLASAMQRYSTGLAAALPSAANAYASTDEWTAKSLNRQLT